MSAVPAAAQGTLRVTAAEAIVYLRPDTASPIVTKLTVGAVVDMQRKESDWYVVLLPPDPQGLRRYGFLAATAVEVLQKRDTPGEAPRTPPTERPPRDDARTVGDSRWARESAFVGVSMTFHRLRGGPPQLLAHSLSSDVLVFPYVNSRSGIVISAGQVFRNSAVEFSYARSTHPAPLQFFEVRGLDTAFYEGEAVYNRLNFDYKRYFVRGFRPQPYLLIGAGFPWFMVRNGALVNGEIANATFSGVGVQIGPGLTFIAHPRVAVDVRAIYRYDLFLSARGGGGDWAEVLDTLNLHGLNVTTGLRFMF